MAKDNRLLAHLPPNVRKRLERRLERVELCKGQTLVELGQPVCYLHFPTSGLVSLLALTRDGGTVELATVTNDGVIGLPGLCRPNEGPYLATVQIGGTALRLRTHGLDTELRTNAALREALFVYGHRLLVEISQSVVCQCFHPVLPRLCRWLLTSADRLETESLDLTQDALAQALGVLRQVISRAALELQDASAISCRHGRIVILNRPLLERTSCECYQALRVDSAIAGPAPPAR